MLDFLQSASNAVASGASVPVDALAWALRKGVGFFGGDAPTGKTKDFLRQLEKPVMGSDWMQEKGFTRPIEHGTPSDILGETAGNLLQPLAPLATTGKAMLLLPAMLRKSTDAAAREFNERIIPSHSTFQKDFKTATGELPDHLRSPSFLVTDRKGFSPFGNDMVSEFGGPLRDLSFIGRPNKLDPSTRVGAIFEGDAGTMGQIPKRITLRQGEQMRDQQIAEWTKIAGDPISFGQDKWPSAKAYLRDRKAQLSEFPGAELKLQGNIPLNVENFAGALMDAKNPNEVLLKQLRNRNLPAQLVNFEKPDEMWDVANWLQHKSMK